MKFIKGLLVGIVSLSVLAACDQNMYGGAGPKQSVGTLGGAVGGGLLGSQVGGGSGRLWATGAGVLLGAIVGSEIGKSLDRADRAYMAQTTYRALESGPSGHPARWINPDSGHYGSVVPQQAYQQGELQCREYTQTINVGGRSEQAYGTACRQQDGSWQIRN